MLRSAGLWRALLHRSRSDWPVVLAAGLLLLCATVLVAAGAVYSDVVAIGGLRQAILEAPPQDRVVVIGSTATPADAGAMDDIVTAEATEVLGDGGGEVGFAAISGGYVPAGADPEDQSRADPLRELSRDRGSRHDRRGGVAGARRGDDAGRALRGRGSRARPVGRRHDLARQPRRPQPRGRRPRSPASGDRTATTRTGSRGHRSSTASRHAARSPRPGRSSSPRPTSCARSAAARSTSSGGRSPPSTASASAG